MSTVSPSTSSTPSTKEPDLNVKNKIEPKDGSSSISTPIRKNSEEASPVELTNSPVPLTPNQQLFGSFNNNNSSNSISGQSVENVSNSNVNAPSSSGQQQSPIVSSRRTESSHFKIGVSEDRNKRCRRTMEVK
jgi:hypothetical protein